MKARGASCHQRKYFPKAILLKYICFVTSVYCDLTRLTVRKRILRLLKICKFVQSVDIGGKKIRLWQDITATPPPSPPHTPSTENICDGDGEKKLKIRNNQILIQSQSPSAVSPQRFVQLYANKALWFIKFQSRLFCDKNLSRHIVISICDSFARLPDIRVTLLIFLWSVVNQRLFKIMNWKSKLERKENITHT